MESLFQKLQPLIVRREMKDILSFRERMANFQLDPFIAPTSRLLKILFLRILFGGLGFQ